MKALNVLKDHIREILKNDLPEIDRQYHTECPECFKNKLYYRRTNATTCLFNCFVCNLSGVVKTDANNDWLPTSIKEQENCSLLTEVEWGKNLVSYAWYKKFNIDDNLLNIQGPEYDCKTQRFLFPLRKIKASENDISKLPLIGRSNKATPKWKRYNQHCLQESFYDCELRIPDSKEPTIFIVEDIISARKIVSHLYNYYNICSKAIALLGINITDDLISKLATVEYLPKYIWLDNDSMKVKDTAIKLAFKISSATIVDSRLDPKYYTYKDYYNVIMHGKVLT